MKGPEQVNPQGQKVNYPLLGASGREWGVTAKGTRLLLDMMKMLRNQTVGMMVQCCDCTKTRRIVCFKRVNYRV